MEWLNFRHLYAFWAVCRTGSFSRAAARIHVSQSTVSAQVAALEDYLEEALIDRNTRSLVVTDQGQALLAYADKIFELSAHVNRRFRDKHGLSVYRTLRVGMVGGISRNFVFGHIEDALSASNVHIEVINGSFDELSARLRSLELDIMLSLDPPRQQDLLSLRYERVLSSPMRLVGTPQLIEQVVAARDEEALPLELYVFRHPFEGRLPEAFGAQHHFVPHVPVRTDDISLLRFLANSGRGCALVPEIGVWEDLKAGRVRALQLTDGPAVDIFAIHPIGGSRQQLVESFLAGTSSLS